LHERAAKRRRWGYSQPTRVLRRAAVPTRPNERWRMDFVRDTLGDGRVFRCCTFVDACTRECLAIEVDFSLPGEGVVRALDVVDPGKPVRIAFIESVNGTFRKE